jgi:thiol-disulfide isomerase/thioredoxin
MRKSLAPIALLSASFLTGPFPARSQTALALPGCEPSPEVRKILDEKLDENALDKMKFAERVAFERQVMEDLIAKYPREFEPYRRLIQDLRYMQPDAFPAIQERFAKLAAKNPNDPLALVVGAKALFNKDTAESIRLLEAAKSEAPNFPWAPLSLAEIYFSGKRADNTKVAENITAFFAICPGSTNGSARWLLTKNAPLQPKVAVALRGRLEKETDPKRLLDYETLWGLEFRTRPPTEHDALRKQIAADLKRLESLNPKGDAEWSAFLIRGNKESGAPQEVLTAMETRLLHEYPSSSEASQIEQERWKKTNKEPEDQNDAAAWKKYNEDYKEALKGWIRQYPDSIYLQRYAWFYTLLDDDTLAEKEGIAALDQFLKAMDDYSQPQYWNLTNAADFLTDHGWQPARAIELGNQARTLSAKEDERALKDDDLSADEVKDQATQEIWKSQRFAGMMLKAAKQAGQPEAVQSLRATIEGVPPEDKKYLSGYWSNRARLAALDNHKQDALAYYQLALQTRVDPPKAWHGKLRDHEMEEAHALWKELGGTQIAWAVWSKPTAAEGEELAEGRWEKPKKEIPVFELADLSGKTWRLKELGGKTILVNLWATWCGPCNAELPRLQKFYEKVKDRSDIQVLTFNLDEDLGLVAPYLKDKGYTFPVLPAYSVVVSLLDGYAIPQNWIVDPKGTWRWSQIGYGGGTDADFQQEMLQKLDPPKSP